MTLISLVDVVIQFGSSYLNMKFNLINALIPSRDRFHHHLIYG